MAFNWVYNPLTGRLDITDVNIGPPGDVEFLEGDSGGTVGPDGSHVINILGGTGANVVGNPGTNTLTINTTGGGFTWNTVAGTSQTLAEHNGYIPLNVALTTFTLPATAAIGDSFKIMGFGSGQWQVAQNAGQKIIGGIQETTVGVGGAVVTTHRYDIFTIICVETDTTFMGYYEIGGGFYN